MDDLHDLLAGRDGLEDRLADRPLLDALDELARDSEVHVGLEQDSPHLPQSLSDHGLGEHTPLPETAEDRVQLLAQLIEHGRRGAPERGGEPWGSRGADLRRSAGRKRDPRETRRSKVMADRGDVKKTASRPMRRE